jgi:hypothetical protein
MAHSTQQRTGDIAASEGGRNAVGNSNEHAVQKAIQHSVLNSYNNAKGHPKTTAAFVVLVVMVIVAVGVGVPLSLQPKGSAAS